MAEKNAAKYSWFVERRNITLISLAVFFFLSLVTFVLCYEHHQHTKKEFLKEDRESAYLLSLVMDGHFQKIIKTMESYAGRPLLIQAVKGKNVEKAKRHLVSLVKSDPDIDMVVITNRQGTLWTAYPDRPEVMGKNFAYSEWYKGVSRNWKPYVSNATLRMFVEKNVAIQICVPFFDEKGRVIGILLNTQRLIELDSIIKQVPLDPGLSISIADRRGQMVYSSRYPFDRQITFYPFYSIIDKVKTEKNRSATVEDTSIPGKKLYVSFAHIAGIGWTILVGRDNRSILLSEMPYYILLSAVTFLLFLMIIFSLVYFRKRVMMQQAMDELLTDEALRASETRFRELFNNMSSGAAIYEVVDGGNDFIFRDFNRSAEQMDKIKKEELLGKRVTEVFPGVKDLGLFEVFQRVWTTGKTDFLPVAFYSDNRIAAWRENNVFKLPTGEIVAVYDDVTSSKQAEEALKISEERFKIASRATNDAVWDWNLITNEIWWGDNFKRFFRYNDIEIEVTIDSWYNNIHPEDRDRVVSGIHAVIESGKQFWSDEYRFRRSDGSDVYIFDRGYVIRDDNGKALRMIGAMADLTDRKQAEEKIRKLNAELEQRVLDRTAQLEAANKELEAFSYSVSHDLRAPLRGIDGFSHILLDEYKDALDGRGKDYLSRIRAGSQRLGELIDDLLKLSRVSRAEIQYETVNLSSAAQTIAEEFKKMYPERHVEFAIADNLIGKGDPNLLRIALENLLNNAFKFTRNNAHGIIEFAMTTYEDKQVYCIRDNGVGFEMEFADKLFGAFQRLHVKSEFEGTGIGLATVQRIIHKHGGKIWAEGEVGKGAVFYFTL
jgi:PAS domain S-box-containing protein